MLKKIIFTSLFCAASAFLFFFLTGTIPLWSSDEGRFAQIAQGMATTKDWVLPYFNGLPYMEKPILANWTTALIFSAAGISAFTARVPGILFGLAGIAALFFWIRRFFGMRAGLISAACLLTTTGYVLVARYAVIDMQLIVLLSAAMLSLMTAYFEEKKQFYCLSAVFMALAFLAKGLIGAALPFLIFISFLAYTRKFSALKNIPWLTCIFIFLLLTLPWIALISRKEPEFLDVFLWQNHFKRFATGSFGRSRPFWFFTYVFLVAAFPWCLFLPAAAAQIRKCAPKTKDLLVFLFLWLGVIFVFFSIPKSKLPYYIIPACVPAAAITGWFLSQWAERKMDLTDEKWIFWTWKIFPFVLFAGAAGVNIALLFSAEVPELALIQSPVRAASAILAAGGLLIFYFQKSDKRTAMIASLAGAAYAALAVVFICMLHLSPMMSTVDFAREISRRAAPDDIIAVYASPDTFSDLPFYLKRRIVIVGTDRGTLAAESKEEADTDALGWFYTSGDFIDLINLHPQTRFFCVLEKERLTDLSDLKSFRILLESHGRILISNTDSV